MCIGVMIGLTEMRDAVLVVAHILPTAFVIIIEKGV
jgi:hypothetical protein